MEVKCAVIHPCFVLLGSESSTVEIHISSELRAYEDIDADGESLENSEGIARPMNNLPPATIPV